MVLSMLPGFSFAPRQRILDDTAPIIGLPICHPSSDAFSFALVVAFGRCKFWLDPCSIGVILLAAIGGPIPYFHVS